MIGARAKISVLSGVIASVVAAASPARAVSPAAEALFQEGRRLLVAGDTAEACARFADSYALEASSGTLLNLALCHEKLGKTATAWAEYRSAARLARKQGRDDRAAVAEEKATALEADLSRLSAVPTKAVPGLVVATEVGTLGEGVLGMPVPVDAGLHIVTVTAPGYRPWSITLEIKEREQLALQIPELTAIDPVRIIVPEKAPESVIPAVETVSIDTQPRRSRIDLYGAAVGGALVVGGAAAWLSAYGDFQIAKDMCNSGSGCTSADRSARISSIERWQGVAVGAWIAGGAVLAASGLHYLLKKHSAPLTVAIDPVTHGVSALAAF